MGFYDRMNERKAFSAERKQNTNNLSRPNNNNRDSYIRNNNNNRYNFRNSTQNSKFEEINKNRYVKEDINEDYLDLPEEDFQKDKEVEYELELENDMLLRMREERIKEEQHQRFQKIGAIIFISLCIYIVFLIYGTINTDYVYDSKGEVVPLIVTVDEIKEIKNFEKVVLQYRQARAIYEEVLLLDYRIAAGVEDPILVAPEYEKVLDNISSLAIQLGAVEAAPEYNQSIEMLLSWVQNDIAIYCQDMSAAIAQNDMDRANRAIQYKQLAYDNFSQITKNLATLGSQVNGADISDIVKWSPEQYIRESVGAVGD